jgi:hypothetical protein
VRKLDLTVQSTRTHESGIKNISTVSCSYHLQLTRIKENGILITYILSERKTINLVLITRVQYSMLFTASLFKLLNRR